jgi:hypothetical protein
MSECHVPKISRSQMKVPPIPLNPHEKRFRWAVVGGAFVLGVLLSLPGLSGFVFSDWPAPFKQLTGLPCPFCGMTRSGQSLLAGDLIRAFYYNALGPVLALTASVFVVGYLVELFRQSHLQWLSRLTNVLLRHVRLGLLFLFVFWLIHLWMALSVPKPELIHPQGILLRWFHGV